QRADHVLGPVARDLDEREAIRDPDRSDRVAGQTRLVGYRADEIAGPHRVEASGADEDARGLGALAGRTPSIAVRVSLLAPARLLAPLRACRLRRDDLDVLLLRARGRVGRLVHELDRGRSDVERVELGRELLDDGAEGVELS